MAEVAVRNDGKYDESRENLKGRNFDDVASQNGDVEVLVTNGVSKFVVQPGGKTGYGAATPSQGERKHRKLERLRSSAGLQLLSNDEVELKTNMFYHISNPITRWKADHSPPIKMILQLLQAVCVITQVFLLMKSPVSRYSGYPGEAQDVFANFFLVPIQLQQPAVPLVRGDPYNGYQYYSYTRENMRAVMNHAGDMFYNNLTTLMGAYDYVYDNESSDTPRPIEVVLTQYSHAQLNPAKKLYVFDGTTNTTTFILNNKSTMFAQFLDSCGKDECLKRFLNMDMKFFVSNIRLIHSKLVHCFIITITLSMVSEGGGRLSLTLTADQMCTHCENATFLHSPDAWVTAADFEAVLSIMIILLCIATFVLTIKALRKAFKLAKAMGKFYQTHLSIPLTWLQRSPLFEYWHFINIISDAVILLGTVMKMVLDLGRSCEATCGNVDFTRIVLGIGVVLQAAVVLRYISYFEQFNALSRALDIAFPRLLKFLVCVGVLFLAFMLCGWVTLKPFHYKFLTVDASFYALFSMLNGDDLWSTYTGMSSYDNLGVFVFSQFFFTIFLILFIYAVLNLFISLIIQSYEESQHQDPHLKDEVRKFVFSGPLTPGGVALKDIIPGVSYIDPEIVKRRVPQSEVKVVYEGRVHGHYTE